MLAAGGMIRTVYALRLMSWSGIASIFVLVGTVSQAVTGLRERSAREALARSAVAANDFMNEIPVWRPRQRRAQRALVLTLLRESPGEADAYRRIQREITGWSLLATGALLAVVSVAVGGN